MFGRKQGHENFRKNSRNKKREIKKTMSDNSPIQQQQNETSPKSSLTLEQLERIALNRANALEKKRKLEDERNKCQEICDGKVCGNTDIDTLLSESFDEHIW